MRGGSLDYWGTCFFIRQLASTAVSRIARPQRKNSTPPPLARDHAAPYGCGKVIMRVAASLATGKRIQAMLSRLHAILFCILIFAAPAGAATMRRRFQRLPVRHVARSRGRRDFADGDRQRVCRAHAGRLGACLRPAPARHVPQELRGLRGDPRHPRPHQARQTADAASRRTARAHRARIRRASHAAHGHLDARDRQRHRRHGQATRDPHARHPGARLPPQRTLPGRACSPRCRSSSAAIFPCAT